ncbi:hypothetical protein Vretifemale_9042 [Volvox reticuliferus]|uniref:PsbP C-terminal domain-containing protein n=1 Tax=Volvox reticuliferus TaxID=1737510 RepID=A0A8J4CHW4_9CHLO|nr:hypothetical protein Vretifemale_9042 [Volvox reticuliferus]
MHPLLAQLTDKSSSLTSASMTGLEQSFSRRALLVISATALASTFQRRGDAARAEEAADLGNATADSAPAANLLTPYSNAKQRYSLMVPSSWDVKGKAGADVLFEDPLRRSTSVGVTVNPVKVASIQQFGTLGDIGDKLLQAEKKKESTLDVVLLASSQRVGTSGATLYEYEYELDSTRGRKRIFNTVTIFNARLYILNASYKCDKEGCAGGLESDVQLLRQVAATFDVTAS